MSSFALVFGAISRQIRFAFVSLLLFVLAACGGGGAPGNDSGATSSSEAPSGFSITLDKANISFTYQEDAPNAAPVVVTATPHGPVPSELYVLATVEGSGISSYIPTLFTAAGAQFTISPQSLPAGTYRGRILLYACADSACAKPIGGSPLPVSYEVNVLKAFKALPRIDLNAVSGEMASGNVAVQLPEGASGLTSRITQGADWLTVGTLNGQVLPISAASLRTGTYYGRIELTTSGQVITVLVVYEVVPPSGGEHDLLNSPSSLTFGTPENNQTTAQAVSISLPTWGGANKDLTYEIQYNGTQKDWLSLTATSTGASVTASAANLSQGFYSAEIHVSIPSSSKVLYIPVAFTVGANMVKPADQTLSITQDTTASALQGSVSINLVNGTPFGWTATSAAPWLKLTRATGLTGTTIQYAVDTSLLTSMANYSDIKTTVTVTPSLSHVSPVSFDVKLRKQLAEAQFVGPYLLVSDKPQTVRLRGKGFNGMSAPAAYVEVDGVQPLNVKLVNDSQLILQLPGLKAGNHKITLKNGLNFPSDPVNLKVVDPTTYSYGAFPTSGLTYWMVYDPWRKSAFLLNKDTERVQRYKFDGSTWNISSTPVVGGWDLGISPDGDSLITLSKSGLISLLNPDTLETTFQLPTSKGAGETAAYLRFGIPSTNDGRSWLTLGDGDFGNELTYFDYKTRTVQTFLSWSMEYYIKGGPWMTASRDGERMVMVQSASTTLFPPMLSMDTTDLTLHANPAGLTYTYRMALSDNGDRLVVDNYEVRDASFALIGRLAIPDNYLPLISIPSPDGRRVYLLTFGRENEYPRVYVFDSSVAPTSSQYLPQLSYFDLPDFPSSCSRYEEPCVSARMAISPDGKTLFIAGDQKFIVAPIPTSTPILSASGVQGRANAQAVGSPSKVFIPVSKPVRWALKPTQ